MAQGCGGDAANTPSDLDDGEGRRRLVHDHLGLVVAAARAYPVGPLTMAELERHGNVGLLHAADEFDPGRHRSFVEHATDHILAAMDAAVASHGPMAEIVELAVLRTERTRAKDRHPTARRPVRSTS